jgi:hypothetical protein
VVEAHRAGPLTLAAYRLPGADALSGGILFEKQLSAISRQLETMQFTVQYQSWKLTADS